MRLPKGPSSSSPNKRFDAIRAESKRITAIEAQRLADWREGHNITATKGGQQDSSPGIDNLLMVRTFVPWIEDWNVEAEEARALFELQLELHQLALGLRPNISSDEMVELRALMEAGDLEGLLARARTLQTGPQRDRQCLLEGKTGSGKEGG